MAGRKIACCWLGCRTADYSSMHCIRCGADGYYDADFIQLGIWSNIKWWVRERLDAIVMRRCDVCRKPTGRGPDAPHICDKDECFRRWLPF